MNTYQGELERGIIAKNLEEFEQAIKYFSAAIALENNHPEPYFYRANIYNHSLQNYPAALADYDRAIALKSDDEGYYYNRALLYLNMGDLEGALEDYEAALKIKPDYALALWDVALIHSELEEFEQALEELDKVLHLAPYSAAIIHKDKGNIYYKLEEFDLALEQYNQSLALDPYSIYAYKGRGTLYTALGRYEEALADLQKALEYAPDDTDAKQRMAHLERKMNI